MLSVSLIFGSGSYAQSPCYQPQLLMVSEPTSSTAILTWSGPPIATSYHVLYKPVNDSVWGLRVTYTSTVNLVNLFPFRCYDVIVQCECEGNGIKLSSAFSPVSFMTSFREMFKR
ncbi:MAG: fibronectin type III domain-containing protein [Bacteroidia bacterium]|nr:fibronectin type III domain-containing protein [Bacteroidia bacterium]